MKLDSDCIRDILLTVESLQYGAVLTIPALADKLPAYSKDTLEYHCSKLLEAGFIDALTVTVAGCAHSPIAQINDLTYVGHEFLSSIRSDTIWNKTKKIAKDIGVSSLSTLGDIALKLAASFVSDHFGT